jgi:ABC-type branched-subunit amino acid transport system ATPase component
VLLLDEPAAGCNPVETEEIDAVIKAIAAQGVAIVLSSMICASSCASRTASMYSIEAAHLPKATRKTFAPTLR